ncbi:FUSC family protein [Actinoallomurus rhizosphaericola]|uniref:FUSC family protein n=1 Tax=Actinoallomurus rhizosphaericola TaxID=2952536 RepID=UPI002091EE09|nr:FUSC family protein [Actinoallomurus rhizosphaericola]MCO5995724.1 FUSC family protein [Actinoallomurus rhizosphaericola]
MSSLLWLRRAFATFEGGAAPVYGLVTAAGVCVPLVAGLITGRVAESQLVALGAFYVGVIAPQGPQGARARSMIIRVAVVTLFSWLGGLVSSHDWLMVVVTSAVAAFGAAIPELGPMAALCTLVAALRPATSPVLYNGLLETLGGAWICALLLAPWVVRRLRPLRAGIAAAACSVADTLDDLAAPDLDPDEWSRRRATAYSDLRSARIVYGLYRSGGFEEQRRPARIIAAIDQVMGEAAVLGALRLESRPYPMEWQAEFGGALTAVAVRLRTLGMAIETDTDVPPDTVAAGSVPMRRLGEHDSRGIAGRAGPPTVALRLHADRIIGRMNASADTVCRVLAQERRIAGRRLPGIRAWWARCVEAVRTRSPRFRHAARMGTALALTMILAVGLHLSHPHWLIVTVLFSLRDSYTDTVRMVLQQAVGTTVGAMAAAVALALAPGRITLLALIFISGALGFTLKPVNTGYWITLGTPMTMLLIDFTAPLNWRAGILRVVLSLAGALLAMLFAQLLFPAGIQRRIAERLARLLHTHAVLARAVAESSRGREARIRGAFRKATSAAATLEAAGTRLRRKAASPDEQISRIGETGRAARRLRERLTSPASFAAVPVGAIATAAREVADHLDQGADEVLAFPYPGSATPQAEVGIRDQRSPEPPGRRRAGLVGHLAPGATSAEPAGAAGTRDMVYGLIADAERLRELSRATVTGRPGGG